MDATRVTTTFIAGKLGNTLYRFIREKIGRIYKSEETSYMRSVLLHLLEDKHGKQLQWDARLLENETC